MTLNIITKYYSLLNEFKNKHFTSVYGSEMSFFLSVYGHVYTFAETREARDWLRHP